MLHCTQPCTQNHCLAIMNEKDIQKIKWDGKDTVLRLESGLYLNIRRSSKTYIIRKTTNGKQHVITLGKSPVLSLREARLEAAKYVLENAVSNVTVSRLIEQYKKDVVDPGSKVPKQVYGYLNHVNARFGRQKVLDVEKLSLVTFIKEYSAERGARSADRIRSYLKQVFDYAVELGYLKGENPMNGVSKRVTGYIAIDRDRVLTPDEIRAVWSWRNQEYGWQKTEDNARLIKFLLLTGLRINEAQKGYADGDKFRIDDTKGKHPKHEKRPHWVYLTKTAKVLLPLPTCTATNIQAWLRRKLESEGYSKSDRYIPHDCRRTYSTLANENGVDPFAVERVLNHKMQGVMSIYNHAEYESERIECAEVVEQVILGVLA